MRDRQENIGSPATSSRSAAAVRDAEEDSVKTDIVPILRRSILTGDVSPSTVKMFAARLGADLLARMVYEAAKEWVDRVPKKIRTRLSGSNFISVHLPDKEVAKWVIKQAVPSSDPDTFSHFEADINKDYARGSDEYADASRGTKKVDITPSTGDDVSFMYRGNEYYLVSEFPSSQDPDDKIVFKLSLEYKIQTWEGSLEDIRALLFESLEAARERAEGHVKVHRMNNFGRWESKAFGQSISMDKVILEAGIKDRIQEDVERFLDDKDFRKKHGIPWRKGYLLKGPPGTGKTTLVRAIASHYHMDLYEVSLSGSEMDDTRLMDAMSEIGEGDVALLEDIDHVFNGEQDGEISGDITRSGLLNAIDGITSQEGRILFMTTNHPEVLPGALTRKGRVDKEYHLGLATQDQVRRLFLKFHPEEGELAEAFADEVGEKNVSPSEIETHLCDYRDPHVAVDECGPENQEPKTVTY